MRTIIILLALVSFGSVYSCDDDSQNNTNNLNNINNANNLNNTNNTNNINNVNNLNNLNNVEIIPENQNKSETEALDQFFPNAEFETVVVGGNSYYLAKDTVDSSPRGLAIVTSNRGFDGMVTTMTGFSQSGETLGIETITQYESWWYMMGISFFTQFNGILFADITLVESTYDKDCDPYSTTTCSYLYTNIGDVDAVSGATYTSDAIIKNITDSYIIYDQIVN
jgi:Na+-translocating ferredoxin:NAD+ oxidoreductase RnfG subunit